MKKKEKQISNYCVGRDGTLQIDKEISDAILKLFSTAIEHSVYTKTMSFNEINPEENLIVERIEQWTAYKLLLPVVRDYIECEFSDCKNFYGYFELLNKLPRLETDKNNEKFAVFDIDDPFGKKTSKTHLSLIHNDFLQCITNELMESMVSYQPTKKQLVHILRKVKLNSFMLESCDEDDPDIYPEFFDDLFNKLHDFCDETEFIERIRRHIEMVSEIPDFKFIFNKLEITSQVVETFLEDLPKEIFETQMMQGE